MLRDADAGARATFDKAFASEDLSRVVEVRSILFRSRALGTMRADIRSDFIEADGRGVRQGDSSSLRQRSGE
jgi:hypothetical protein